MAASSTQEFMPYPMCLVANEEDGTLVVQQETVDILSTIKQPIVVVAIVGIYRTGKSFLMNRLMGRNKGFALGATIESKTKGIWAWCRKHPKRQDCYLLLLDTEGLGDIEKDDEKNDNWIFALSVLLSCTLVYSSQGSLQGNGLEKLSYVTELTYMIKLKSSQDEGEEDPLDYVKYFPNFVWVLRDFTLTVEINGKPETADEYLKNALRQKRGSSKKVLEYNRPRQCIEEYFKNKKCFVLKRPVNNDELFKTLDDLKDTELDQDFLREVNIFCEYIFTETMPKSLDGRCLNGSMICELLKTFVETIQRGKLLNMEKAVKMMTDNVNSQAVQTAIDHYRKKMEQSLLLPVDLDILGRQHKACFDEAMKIFVSESYFGENEQHQKELEDLLNNEYENKYEENNTCSKAKCNTLLNDLSKNLDQNVRNCNYSKSGGHEDYENEKQKVIELYHKTPGKGTMAEATLKERLFSWESREALIVSADKTLTEAGRKAAEDKRNYENERQQKLAAEEEIKQQKQKLEDKEKSHQENMKMMEKKRLEDEQKHKQEIETIMKRKEEELRTAVDLGLRKAVADIELAILKLRLELDERRNQSTSVLGAVGTAVVSGVEALASGVASGVEAVASGVYSGAEAVASGVVSGVEVLSEAVTSGIAQAVIHYATNPSAK